MTLLHNQLVETKENFEKRAENHHVEEGYYSHPGDYLPGWA